MSHDLDHTPTRVILSAMDKFRGTASSRELAAVIERVTTSHALLADVQPMSDGGEGFLDAFDGDVTHVDVPGPLLEPVSARIKVVGTTPGATAVVELSDVVGRDLLPSPSGREALIATSEGAGVLILAAARLDVDAVLVGCGGTATSDGGLGCYRVLAAAGGVPVKLTAATDVTTHFSGALRYAQQKGVNDSDLERVDERLREARALYREDRGVDVELIERTGAAGGISGALAAWGAELTSGVDAVARSVNLAARLRQSSMVITGEGRLDAGSLEGKVTLGVALMVDENVPLLVVCGSLEEGAAEEFRRRFANATLVSLEERFGSARAFSDVLACLESVARDALRQHFWRAST